MCIEPPLPPHRPSLRPKISCIIASVSQPLAMQWPWPRWVLAMRSTSVRCMQNADARGLLAGVEMDEARDVAGRELVVDALLELADRAHLVVGLEQIVAAELHVCLPVRKRSRSCSIGAPTAALAQK